MGKDHCPPWDEHMPSPSFYTANNIANPYNDDDNVLLDELSDSTLDLPDLRPDPRQSIPLNIVESPSRPSTNITDEPIDLTGSPSPPFSRHASANMPPTTRKRTRDQASVSSSTDSDAFQPSSRSKRQRPNPTPNPQPGTSASRPSESSAFQPPLAPPRQHAPPLQNRTIEQIDLCEDDDGHTDKAAQDMQQVLQRQRAEQIASQSQAGPSASSTHPNNTAATIHPTTSPANPKNPGHTKLTTLSCSVCLESPTDLTATTCGHAFCRSCLMDWLVSSDRDQPRRPNCPACRKGLSWREGRSGRRDVVPVCFMKRAGGVGVA